MTNPKIAAVPHSADDKMPYPPAAGVNLGNDLGADAEAAVQSAQTFTPANEDDAGRRVAADPDAKPGRWHTPLLLIVAALVGAAFLLAIR
ncbi:hypothetical protein FNB15_13175 [Ferrovibrio terrae]|uniref:Uncharacterized protein n=1 Tax=Ferrovibrio terrae TaxID=2594003 RepID=A0A516H308_9PROT|nr:hypothetical protein [Ferrovibrio terrae]QDO98163.1 hypothetical protein FNB15_13175 [Ferrovibrio terrae]